MTKTQSWIQFTKERFEPWSHLTMIAVFLLAHLLVAKALRPITASAFLDVALIIGVIAFYFKLRLYDEVKDYELDVVINKHRPLPRGLLTHKDMYRGMAICIAIELVCFGLQGMNGFLAIIIAILYSLLMYKEFFIAEKIRPLLTTYALIHTIVTTFLSFAIFSFLTGETFLSIIRDPQLFSFALSNWLLFNIFEFGRKTFATSEERENVDTYSSLFGRTGAVMLVVSQAVIAHFLVLSLKGAHTAFLLGGFGLLLLILGLLSGYYISSNSVKAAKMYRNFSSVYIIVFYLILIIGHII